MSDDPKSQRDELFEVIEDEAADEDEVVDSKFIFDALKEHSEELGGSADVPADDQQLSESIHNAAARRSAEITGVQRASSQSMLVKDKPIPVWLWVAWALALVGAVVAFMVV